MLSLDTVWVFLYLVVLCALLYWSLLFSSLHAFALACVVYVAFYLVAYAPDGSRQWSRVRRLGVWDWARPYQVLYDSDTIKNNNGRYLFITETFGGTANWRMSLWAFALQGPRFPVQALVCLPYRIFYVPYVTDVLQWLGCIAEGDFLSGFENTSVVVTRDFFDRNIVIGEAPPPLYVTAVLHRPEARCTLIGDPFVYSGGLCAS